MGQDNKDFADQNAHERTPPNRSVEGSADRSSRGTQGSSPGSGESKKENPLDLLRYGSAGSGGAEREPGPERP